MGASIVLSAQQFPSRIWHDGRLVIEEQDTVRGKIMYDLDRNVVQVDVGDQIFTYGAKKIVFFEIFDVTVDAYRQFYSIPFAVSPGYKTELLFEVVVEGKMSLLCRESIARKPQQYDSYTWSRETFTQNVLVYDYYFLTPDGIMVQYFMKKKDLFIIMYDHADRVKEYMKVYRLKPDEKGDLARITAYYNSLIES